MESVKKSFADFYKNTIKDKKNCTEAKRYVWKKIMEHPVSRGLSFVFILLTTKKDIFSTANGAIWILLWYTVALVMTGYFLYLRELSRIADRKIKNYERKNRKNNISGGKADKTPLVKPGGATYEEDDWIEVVAQLICAMLLAIVVAGVSKYLEIKGNISEEDTKFFWGLAMDSYFLVFSVIYLKIFSHFWKNRKKEKEEIIQAGRGIKTGLIVVTTLVIIGYTFVYYVMNEFDNKIFPGVVQKIIGVIYVCFVLFEAFDLRSLLGKRKV